MRIFSLLAGLLLLSNSISAQYRISGDGTIKGIITDSLHNAPVAYATIGIYTMPKDSLIAGTLSDEKGMFLKENLSDGNYVIKISCVGYQAYSSEIYTVSEKSIKINLNIKLSPSATDLGELNVSGQRTPFEQTFNKKIFLMDEKRNATAINVLDLLKTLPSITVDPEGNVKYRGQTPNILVDDQPYTLLYPKLEMITAANVDKIEFIEPSARYESSVGTINIKLKTPKENGLSGAIYTRVGTVDFSKLQQNSNGLNINLKRKKLIVFGNINYNFWNGGNDYTEDVWFNYNNKLYTSTSLGGNDYKSTNISESTGFIYNFTKKKKLTFTFTPSQRRSRSESDDSYNEYLNDTLREFYNSTGLYKDHNTAKNFSLNYTKKFSNEEKEFTLKALVSLRNTTTDSRSLRAYTYHSYTPSDSVSDAFTQESDNRNRYSFDLYYTVPIDSSGRWEMGTQSQFTQGTNETDYFFKEVFKPMYSNRFKGILMSHAAYCNYGTKWKKFKVDAGLRAAIKVIDLDLTVFPNNVDSLIPIQKTYPYFVPNTTISYEIKPFHELKLTYQLDQQVPSEDQLNPYIEKSNPRYWYSGNPNLKPYLYHRFSFGYVYSPGKYSFSLDAFHYFSNNNIEWVTIPINDYTTYNKPENVGKSNGTGITLTGSAMPNDWFNCNVSADVFKSNMDASKLSSSVGNTALSTTGLVTGNWSVTGNSYFSVYIKKKNSISLYLSYMGRNTNLGGYSKGSLYNGIYVSRRFLSNKLSVYVSINNLIDKYSKWSTTSEYFGRKQVSEYRGTWNKRSFGISVRYSFNKGDRGLLNTQTDDGGDSGTGKGGKGK